MKKKKFKWIETDETCQKPTPTFRKIVFQVRLRRHFTIVRGDNGIIDQWYMLLRFLSLRLDDKHSPGRVSISFLISGDKSVGRF